MQSEIDAATVVWYHDRQLRERDWPIMSHGPIPSCPSGVWEWIAANHRYNGLGQRERTRMGRLDVSPAEIGAGKRLAERYDQKRRDAQDAIDRALLAGLRDVACRPDARLSDDTAGAMIDRLSVLALQIAHVRAQARCTHADADDVHAATGKLERLLAQRRDVMACLDALLAEARAGRAYFRCRPRTDGPDALPGDTPPRVLRQEVPHYLAQGEERRRGASV